MCENKRPYTRENVMFKVIIHNPDQKKQFTLHTTAVDSLPEAEIMALGLVRKQYRNDHLMLVHKGELVYEIYEIFEPIGSVQIKTM